MEVSKWPLVLLSYRKMYIDVDTLHQAPRTDRHCAAAVTTLPAKTVAICCKMQYFLIGTTSTIKAQDTLKYDHTQRAWGLRLRLGLDSGFAGGPLHAALGTQDAHRQAEVLMRAFRSRRIIAELEQARRVILWTIPREGNGA